MGQISSGSLTIVDVTDGAPGLNNTTVFLYQRAVNAPNKPTGNLTYTFATATVTGSLDGWVQNINSLTGSNPIWMIAAVASSNGSTDVIEPSEWAGPIKMAQNGQDGQPGTNGTNGLNQATVFIYKRGDSATTPSSVTYTFSTGNFTTPSGWNKTIPTTPKGKPCWVTSAIAIGAEATAELNWATPSVLVEDGSDGVSPIVTATENGVKIVDADGNETTITNGADGTSYYTFVRYSQNANGSGYVVTPTSETVYIGVYTGTESSPPVYSDAGWKWSRYVGADGQPGTQGPTGPTGPQGVSVTATRELYYLKTNSTDPVQITNADQIHTTDDVNQWTSVVPTYIGSGKYYTCIETNLSTGNSVWSAPVENKGLTDANVNATNAIEIARGVKQHFFWVATDKSENIPAGAYVAEQSEEAFYSSPTKGNILTRSDGIWIRNGADKLATLQGSGLTFLVPTGTYKGQQSVSLNGSGLTFYNIGSSNSAAATLASDGLQITNGSIVLGTTSGTTAGNVTLSNQNFTRSINGTSHNDLRFAIGSKFGVASDGTLYSSGLDSVVSRVDDIEDWEIGGRNLLHQTQKMTDWILGSRSALNEADDYNYLTIVGSTSDWSANISLNPLLSLDLLDGSPMMLSFEYKASANWTLANFACAGSASSPGESYTNRTKYTNLLTTSTTVLPSTSTWKRVVVPCRSLTPSDFTSGSGDVNSWLLQIFIHQDNITVDVRKIKLEKGNKATDWTPAPEDISASISELNTSITQNADAIKLEASRRESAVNMLLDSDAKKNESSDYPSTSSNGIEKASEYAQGTRYWSDSGNTMITCTLVSISDPPESGIKYAARFVCDGTQTAVKTRGYAFYEGNGNKIPLTLGQTYTASWWARCTDGSGQTQLNVAGKSATAFHSYIPNENLTSEWKRYTYTFTFNVLYTSSDYQRIWFYSRFPANTAGTVEICGCKLVAGDAVEAYKTTIEQTADNVLIKATKTGATDAEKQAGGQATIESMINVAPEGVKIAASKVEIDGTAIFTAIKSSADAAYDAKGAASTAESNAKSYADNIEASGKNLHKNPDTLGSGWSIVHGAVSNGVATLTSTASEKARIYQSPSNGYWSWKADTVYTVSIEAKADTTGVGLRFECVGSSSTVYEKQSVTLTTDWATYRCTFTTGSLSSPTASMSYWLNTFSTSCQFRNPKLELGRAAEDTPSKASAVAKTQRIYYRSNSSTKPTAYPTAWVTEEENKWNGNATTASGWTRKVTPISNGTESSVTKYLYLWTATQKQMVDGTTVTLTASDIALDDSTTVIDGGNVITGTVTANKLNASDINASKSLTVGAMTDAAAETILNSNIEIGGRNLLLDTGYPLTAALTSATADYYLPSSSTWWEESEYGKSKTNNNTTDYMSVSFDWTTTSSTGVAWLQIDGNIVANIKDAGGYGTSKDRINLADGSGHYWAVFKLTATQAGKTTQRMRIRIAGSNTAQTANSTFTISNLKFETGVKPTDWTPAPEDVQAEIDGKTASWVLKSGNANGASYSTILGYAAEGTQTTFSIDSSTPTTGIKAGDTVRLAYLANNMGTNGTIVYIVGTVKTTPASATSITLIGHGLDTTVIDGGHILTGTIDANRIGANSITANKLAVGDFNNYVTVTEKDANSILTSGDTIENGWLKTNAGYSAQCPRQPRWTTNGESYRITGTVKAPADGLFVFVMYARNSNGSMVSNTANYKQALSANTETTINTVITLNNAGYSTAALSDILVCFCTTSTWTENFQSGYIKNLKCERMSGGELIVDGSITADKIAIGAIEEYENILLDSDAPTLTKVKASYGRYWSDSGNNKIVCNHFSLTDAPEQGLKYGRRFTYDGSVATNNYLRAYAFYDGNDNMIPLIPNQTYTATWWARCTSGSGCTQFCHSKGDGATGTVSGTIYTLTSYWKKYTHSFTFGSALNTNYNRIWFRALFPKSTAGTVEICGCKLTVDADAESYITRINSDGIRIHPSSTENNSVVINANGMQIYKGSVSVAEYGDTARIGKNDSSRFLMNADSLQAYNSSNKKYFEVSASSMKFGTDLGSTVATTSNVASAAKTATSYITDIDSNNGITIKAVNGATSGSDATKQNYVKLNADGLDIYQEGTSVARYGDYARVGKDGEANTTISPNQVTISASDNINALRITPNGNTQTIYHSITREHRIDADKTYTFTQPSAIPSGTTAQYKLRRKSDNSLARFEIKKGTSKSTTSVTTPYPFQYSATTTQVTIKNTGSVAFYLQSIDYSTTEVSPLTEVGGVLSLGQYPSIGIYDVLDVGYGSSSSTASCFSVTNYGFVSCRSLEIQENNMPISLTITDGTGIDALSADASNNLILGRGWWAKNASGYNTYIEGYQTNIWGRNKIATNMAITQGSDKRLKKDIKDLEDVRDFVMDLKPVEFKYEFADDKAKHLGFIAQDVEKSMGAYGLSSDKYGLTTEITSTDNIQYKGLNYTEFIPICIKMIQEQQQEIDALKEALNEVLSN